MARLFALLFAVIVVAVGLAGGRTHGGRHHAPARLHDATRAAAASWSSRVALDAHAGAHARSFWSLLRAHARAPDEGLRHSVAMWDDDDDDDDGVVGGLGVGAVSDGGASELGEALAPEERARPSVPRVHHVSACGDRRARIRPASGHERQQEEPPRA